MLFERSKIRQRNKKGDSKILLSFKVLVALLSQSFLSILFLAYYYSILNQGDGLSDQAVYSALKNIEAKDFIYIAVGVAAVSIVDGVNKVALSVMIFYAALLIILMPVVIWIPEGFDFSAQNETIQTTVTFALITVFVCMFWIPFNAVVVLVTRISNLGHASKNDSAQPSPAPSDLAHDLRYSRSRARRSRAQR